MEIKQPASLFLLAIGSIQEGLLYRVPYWWGLAGKGIFFWDLSWGVCSENMSRLDGVGPWNVPVHHHNGRWNSMDGRLRVGEVALRCLICGLAVLVAALVGTDTQAKTIVYLERKAKFTDMKASV